MTGGCHAWLESTAAFQLRRSQYRSATRNPMENPMSRLLLKSHGPMVVAKWCMWIWMFPQSLEFGRNLASSEQTNLYRLS